MTLKEKLFPIAIEAVDWDMDEKTAIEYVAFYDQRNQGKKPDEWKRLARSTWYEWKKEIESDDTLNKYFNHHTRIGFVKEQKKRAGEMSLVLKILKQKFLELSGRENVDVYRLVRLSEALVNANKRAEEISLSNPTIAAIKMEVDKANGTESAGGETPEGSRPHALAEAKF